MLPLSLPHISAATHLSPQEPGSRVSPSNTCREISGELETSTREEQVIGLRESTCCLAFPLVSCQPSLSFSSLRLSSYSAPHSLALRGRRDDDEGRRGIIFTLTLILTQPLSPSCSRAQKPLLSRDNRRRERESKPSNQSTHARRATTMKAILRFIGFSLSLAVVACT